MSSFFSRVGLWALRGIAVVAVLALVGLGSARIVRFAAALVGDEALVVTETNMRPQLFPGDLAIVEPVRAETLGEWDVITYASPTDADRLITRRVMYLDADSTGFVAGVRGDAEPITEQLRLTPTTPTGRVQYFVPRLGLVVAFAEQSAGSTLLLGLAAVALATYGLQRRLSRIRRRSSAHPLIEEGRRALGASDFAAAIKAANAVLAKDPNSRAAWLLVVEARHASQRGRELKQARSARA
jgi:hypothetical protein